VRHSPMSILTPIAANASSRVPLSAFVAETTPIDVGVLAALVGNDADTLRGFLESFRDSASAASEELQRACSIGSLAGAEAVAHRLKSSARAVGALAIGQRCAEIERVCAAGDFDALADLHVHFEYELRALFVSLERLCPRR
jgi:two-component system sensor histidine kinase/response regulator